MSLLSIDDWQNFMNGVGEDFYDLVHDAGGQSDTKVDYPQAIQYKGAYKVQYPNDVNYYLPVIGDFSLIYGSELVFKNYDILINSNKTSSGIISGSSALPYEIIALIEAPHSYTATGSEYEIFKSSNGYYYVAMKDASNNYNRNIFHNELDFTIQYGDGTLNKQTWSQYGSALKLNTSSIDLLYDSSGYDYYFQGSYDLPSFSRYDPISPIIVNNYPCIVNTNYISSPAFINDVKNNYFETGDTVTTYTYNIDNNNYITTNYTVDSDGVPTGYIDIQPTGNISFDDLFDLFNTILAPLVGVGLDLPDWTDYEPQYPAVTGDINVNIDLPDVTWSENPTTIRPIESEVNYIMSDGFPQLPSVTMDVDNSVGALNAGFTFYDGLGLLSPFIILAVIRLLISKFRGDS